MCWKCKNPIDVSESIYRSSTCSFCGKDLHSCRNCKFYESGAHYDCRENVTDLVKDKERANFCEWFSARSEFGMAASQSSGVGQFMATGNVAATDKAAKSTQAENAREAFNALFGD